MTTTNGVGSRPIRGHALVVEDDDLMRALLIEVLTDRGFRVSAFGNGAEALAALGREGLEDLKLAVIDIRLPGANGISVAHALQISGWTGRLVMISAFADEHRRESVRALGATLLDKPFKLSKLFAVIEA